MGVSLFVRRHHPMSATHKKEIKFSLNGVHYTHISNMSLNFT